MLVTVTHPQPGPLGRDIYGAVVAAPAWHDIAVNLYRLFGITPQPGSTPHDLARLLAKDAKAQAAWAKLSYTNKKEIARSLEEAKQPATRERRLETALQKLRA